jgi:hypothetical protein
MPVKKPAESKKAVADPKKAHVDAKTASLKVWTLPIAMLMAIVAAGGLWFAVRESSAPPQAATPAATNPVMAADAGKPAAKPAASSSPSKPATATSVDTVKTQESAPGVTVTKTVSVTGCLQRGDRGFTLKDTEGTDAPKSRSWKSGFLKRNTASIALRDTGNTAHFADHVGQRVSVTGPLTDREMRVQSLRRVSASCQ